MNDKDLERYIREEAIDAQIVYLDNETPTVQDAANAVGVHPDKIGKTLLFLADGDPLLVISNGESRVQYKRLASFLGISRKRLRLANAVQVEEITGYVVGTVPPFAHRRSLETLVDRSVIDQEEIFAGGGTINALLKITTDELLRVTNGKIANL